MASRGASTGRIVAGVVLVAAGVLFLLAQFTELDVGSFFGTFWPLFLIGFGGWATYQSRGRNLFGIVVLFIGVGFQLATLDVIDMGWMRWGWAVLLILIGLWLVLFRPFPGREKGQDRAEWTDVLGMFSGPKVHVANQAWKGGEVTVLFGGAELDLRDAMPAPDGANLEVTAVFGGVEILVPRTWVVDVKGTPILGSVDDHTVVDAQTDESQDPSPLLPRLTIRATAIFGGVDVKH